VFRDWAHERECVMANFLMVLDDDILTVAQALADLISSWIF
jgi:hypothetical protein